MSDKPRIHIPADRIQEGSAPLTRQEAHYLMDVLRLRPGAVVTVFDGAGNETTAVLSPGDGRNAVLELQAPPRRAPADPNALDVTVLAALIKHRNFDLVVQKAAELGASRLIPTVTIRTVKEAGAGGPRWRRISVEASRQSRRRDAMAVEDPMPLEKALTLGRSDLMLVAWEGGADDGIKPLAFADALSGDRPSSVSLAVGPEGGFTVEEVRLAVACGFVAVRLGPRILRSETAPLAMLAVLQYLFGDLGGRQENRA